MAKGKETVEGAALDASVLADNLAGPGSRQVFVAASVEYLERELGEAEAAVDRLNSKREKFQAHLYGIEDSIAEAEEARDKLAAELEDAKSELEALVDEEVDA